MDLLKPMPIKVKDVDGMEHDFIISRLPASVGREVLAKYPTSALPKIGDYDVSAQAMMLMMKYVAKPTDDGGMIRLTTQSLIDNHVPDGEALLRLEIEMLKHNTSFFGHAGSFDFRGFLQDKIKQYAPLIMKTLTDLSQQSSQADSQRTQSSKKKST